MLRKYLGKYLVDAEIKISLLQISAKFSTVLKSVFSKPQNIVNTGRILGTCNLSTYMTERKCDMYEIFDFLPVGRKTLIYQL